MMLEPLLLLGLFKVLLLEPNFSSLPLEVPQHLIQFYLKDVASADLELCHLGPVVAAQQIHH